MQMLPPIKSVLEDFHSEELVKIENDIDALQDLCTLIEEAIVEEPPISIDVYKRQDRRRRDLWLPDECPRLRKAFRHSGTGRLHLKRQ